MVCFWVWRCGWILVRTPCCLPDCSPPRCGWFSIFLTNNWCLCAWSSCVRFFLEIVLQMSTPKCSALTLKNVNLRALKITPENYWKLRWEFKTSEMPSPTSNYSWVCLNPERLSPHNKKQDFLNCKSCVLIFWNMLICKTWNHTSPTRISLKISGDFPLLNHHLGTQVVTPKHLHTSHLAILAAKVRKGNLDGETPKKNTTKNNKMMSQP